MKVLEVTNVDFSLRHFLLPLMRGLRERGHEVIGACADGPLLEIARNEGFTIRPVALSRSLSPFAAWRGLQSLRALIRAEKPDLVHAHMPISGFLARLAAWLEGVPAIAYTCHGFLFNQPGPWPRRALGFLIEFIAGRFTTIYMTVSNQEARDARRLHIHADAMPCGNGRDPARYRPDALARARIRAELGVPEDRIVVIIVSRLVRHKGHPELLEAMQNQNAELWVVGERLASDHGEDLEPYFAASTAHIRRLGYREDIPALLAAADIFALPSHFEGLPMSVIEAMLTGLPIIATNIRGPREQVLDGETGLLVPSRNAPALAGALQRLISDPALRTRLGTASLDRARTLYDEARVVSHTLDLLGA
jgi:glycosyltransferase involved in cell wall biosynthesis